MQCGECEVPSLVERLALWNYHIRNHSLALPIRLRDWIDRAASGKREHEMLANKLRSHGMRAASRRFSHDCRALQCLEVVRELFSTGKSLMTCEHKNRLGAPKLSAGNVGPRPELIGAVGRAPEEIVEVHALIEQIRTHIRDHAGVSPCISPQVDDERI